MSHADPYVANSIYRELVTKNSYNITLLDNPDTYLAHKHLKVICAVVILEFITW